MSRNIGQYVSTCDLCLWTKPWQHSLVGKLQLLSVPDAWWDMLSVDFVVELPESSGDGDQRKFDLEIRVITNENIIIPKMFHSCVLNK